MEAALVDVELSEVVVVLRKAGGSPPARVP
jgi:hypothetical protein